jgi:CPA2 family monovalent cation:H+ antiporter-2
MIQVLERWAPVGLVRGIEVYSKWVGSLGNRTSTVSGDALKSLLFQLGLHAAFVGSIFSVAAYFSKNPPGWLVSLQLQASTLNSALWLIALIGSLPFLVVSVGKLSAFGKVLAENKVSESVDGIQTAFIRSTITTITPVLGGVVLALYVMMLSSTLLPPTKVLLSMIVVLGFVVAATHRSMNAFHLKWQSELEGSLVEPAKPLEKPALSVLRESNLSSVILPTGGDAVGKRIRELQLRSRTGASIVGIEREDRVLVNPEPDEELNTGDRILLLGNPDQLRSAELALLQNESQRGGGIA